MSKTEEWLLKNSIRENERYYIKVLSSYGFELDKNCKINPHHSGDSYISLSCRLTSYLIEIDQENMVFNLLKQNFKSFNTRRKERHRLIKSFDNILNVLNFIKGTSFKLVS